MKDFTSARLASKKSDDIVRKMNVARVLFEQQMLEPAEGAGIFAGHQRRSYVYERSNDLCQQRTANRITKSSTLDGSVSTKTRQLISDFQVIKEVSHIKPSPIQGNNTTNNLYAANHLSTTGNIKVYKTSWASDKSWDVDDDFADETVYLPNINKDDVELEKSWVGYETIYFKSK